MKGLETDLTWGISSSPRTRRWRASRTSAPAGTGSRCRGTTSRRGTTPTRAVSSPLRPGDQQGRGRGHQPRGDRLHRPKWASGVDNRESPPLNPADYADFMSFAANRWGSRSRPGRSGTSRTSRASGAPARTPPSTRGILQGRVPRDQGRRPDREGRLRRHLAERLRLPRGRVRGGPEPRRLLRRDGHPSVHGVASPAGVALQPRRPDREVVVRRLPRAARRRCSPMATTSRSGSPSSAGPRSTIPWGVTEATQAAFLTQAYNCAETDPYVQVAIWYAYRNHPFGGDGQNWEYQLGLTRTDFSPQARVRQHEGVRRGSGRLHVWLSVACTRSGPSGRASAAGQSGYEHARGAV